MELKNKKIAVLGLGREGLALARYFKCARINADFLDESAIANSAEIESLGYRVIKRTDAFNDLNKYDLIFRSPGISINHSHLKNVKSKLTSLTRLFFELWPGKIIGVTGTKGKGTTASIIKSILSEDNIPSILLGNIGEVNLNNISRYKNNAVAVYELSSFQLIKLGVSPNVAVVLDISQEHLDYHKSIHQYRLSKLEIAKYQKSNDWLVITCDNPSINMFSNLSLAQKIGVSLSAACFEKSVWWHESAMQQSVSGNDQKIIELSELKVVGKHNMINAAAAAGAALALGININSIRQGIINFDGLPYRLQNIGVFGGITFYNDSASTNPATTLAAAAAIPGQKIIIMGGRNKGLDYSETFRKLNLDSKVSSIVIFGELRSELNKYVGSKEYNKFVMVENLDQAIEKVVELSKPDQSVIFSPGAASFDQFSNYEIRGQTFNKIIYGLNNRQIS